MFIFFCATLYSLHLKQSAWLTGCQDSRDRIPTIHSNSHIHEVTDNKCSSEEMHTSTVSLMTRLHLFSQVQVCQ